MLFLGGGFHPSLLGFSHGLICCLGGKLFEKNSPLCKILKRLSAGEVPEALENLKPGRLRPFFRNTTAFEASRLGKHMTERVRRHGSCVGHRFLFFWVPRICFTSFLGFKHEKT